MSYVIQNFSKLNTKINVTPRFKTTIALKQSNYFFLLNKFQNIRQTFELHDMFLKFFHTKGLFSFFYSISDKLSANYTNQLTNTAVFWTFKILDKLLTLKNFKTETLKHRINFLYNSYFLSIKIINVKTLKTYFKTVFFFFLFFFNEQWYQFHNYTHFHLNFFFIRNNFKLYKFYGGYFFKIYNF